MSALVCGLVLHAAVALAQSDRLVASGEVIFSATASEADVPLRFRLPNGAFAWQVRRMQMESETLEVWDVTFPSPVKTLVEANNTVYCEFYRSRQPGRRPAVIVLHILGGDFPLSRLFCNWLAQNGVHALFVKMPYYGPRRDPNSPARMVSSDPEETVAGLTQAVLDIRRATCWLADRSDVEAKQLGIFGISLGGITGALAATAEPRLQNVCLLLAGGDIASVGWDARETKAVRQQWLDRGGTRQTFINALRVIDPVTYAGNVRGKRILMLNAADDEVIPRVATDSLWRAFGQPEIEWYPGGHYSVIWQLPSAMVRVSRFFVPTASD